MAPTTKPHALEDAHAAWIETNPLRRWRTEQRLSMMRAGALMGASISSVSHWEMGSRIPTEESFGKLAKLMGVKASKLVADWNAWIGARP